MATSRLPTRLLYYNILIFLYKFYYYIIRLLYHSIILLSIFSYYSINHTAAAAAEAVNGHVTATAMMLRAPRGCRTEAAVQQPRSGIRRTFPKSVAVFAAFRQGRLRYQCARGDRPAA